PAVYHFENTGNALTSSDPFLGSPLETPDEISTELLEEIHLLLGQYSVQDLRYPKFELNTVVPTAFVTLSAVIIGSFFVEKPWVSGILTLLASVLAAGWLSHFLYGFLYGRTTEGTYKNLIDEVQEAIDRRRRHEGQKSLPGSRAGSDHRNGSARNSLIQ
ncbi:hypothetical protein BGZ94_003615, partial [Podila epigama]